MVTEYKYNLDIDFSNYINERYYDDGYTDIEINTDGAESEAYDRLNIYLDDFNQTVLKKVEYDISGIFSDLDLNQMAQEYLESYEYENENGITGSNESDYSSPDDIDAIFERS